MELHSSRQSARFLPLERLTGACACLAAALGVSCGPSGPTADGGDGPAICGDGSKHADEPCDDGNLIAGDGCSPECNPSGMPYDCVDLLTQDSLDDWDSVLDLLPLADGSFIAAGQIDATNDGRGWLARFEPSGARRWFVDAASLDANIDQVTDLAGDQTGIWALASSDSIYDDRLVRFDEDGSATSTMILQSETGGSVDVKAIEVTDAGVWLAGRIEYDVWVGLYDPMLNTVRDILSEDHLGYRDTADAVVRDGDGIAVAATLSSSPNFDFDVPLVANTDILVIWFDQHGGELRRTLVGPYDNTMFARSAYELGSDGAGRWFVGGHLQPFDNIGTQGQVWVAQVDAGWIWITSEASGTGYGGLLGVEDGVLVGVNPTSQGWLGELAPDGSERWTFDIVGDDIANYEGFSHRVLVHDREGRIRTSGITLTPGVRSTVRSCLVSR